MFFSHVGKMQPRNRLMLKEVVAKQITLIDYEYLTDYEGNRIIAFGRWTGMVGAYNALRGMGVRTETFDLKPAYSCRDMKEMFAGLKLIWLKPIKILITGGGRVAKGDLGTLRVLKIREVTPKMFLEVEFDEPVMTRLDPQKYVKHKYGMIFDLQHFYDHPWEYVSTFKPYQKVAELQIVIFVR